MVTDRPPIFDLPVRGVRTCHSPTAGSVRAMPPAETPEAAYRSRAMRPFTRGLLVALVLLGLVLMHGACMSVGIAASGGAESRRIGAPVTEVASPAPSQDHDHSGHGACCGHAVEAGCAALLAVSLLLLLGLTRCGAGVRLDISRHPQWAMPAVRAGPHDGLQRFALCVMRV